MKPAANILVLTVAGILGGCAAAGPQMRAAPPPMPALPASASAHETLAPQNESSLYLNLIDGLIAQQRYGAALAFLDDYALKQSDPGPRYWMLRGDALLGSGRGEEAGPVYAKLEATPLAAEGWNGRGRVAASLRQWKEAEILFAKAVQIRPTNPQFLNNLAFAKIHLRQGAEAAFDLRQAHELDPNSVLIRNNFIVALNLAGDPASAERVLGEIKNADERERVRDFAKKTVARDGIPEGEKS
ncbi:MAG TPA: tetratricopeptide repeat protein [Rhizomicrobium sp.]|nr:tetratricopeptide repeat protein [Rhizomicrobium sp.]